MKLFCSDPGMPGGGGEEKYVWHAERHELFLFRAVSFSLSHPKWKFPTHFPPTTRKNKGGGGVGEMGAPSKTWRLEPPLMKANT